jgi:DNA-binding LacI/PurR family transcriptional regulator
MEKEKIFKTKIEILKEKLLYEIFQKKPGEKLPTEYELAKFFGVNRSTINKVLSLIENEGLIERKTGIGSIVKERNERRLNYRIGVIVERSSGHVYEYLTRLMIKKIQDNRFFPLLVDLGEPTEKILSHLKEILENNPEFVIVDGIGYFPFNFLKENNSKIRNLIFINRFETNLKFNATYILSDYEKGGYTGAKYLIEKVKEKILIITQSNPSYKPNIDEERLKGVRRAFEEYGIEFGEKNIIVNKNREYLKEALKKVIEEKKEIRGIFAFADNVGRETQEIMEEFGLWLGIDYIMVGYFNTSHSIDFSPQFPSVSINEKGLIEKLEEILNNGFPKEIFKVEPVLVERKLREREVIS